jgi:hypothetical protein
VKVLKEQKYGYGSPTGLDPNADEDQQQFTGLDCQHLFLPAPVEIALPLIHNKYRNIFLPPAPTKVPASTHSSHFQRM